MEIKQRTEKVGRSKANPISEIVFDSMIIYVLEGSRGNNQSLDLFIKYSIKNDSDKVDYISPKHIHWATDLLIKKEHKKGLARRFAKLLVRKYETFKKNNPIVSRNHSTIKTVIEANKCDLSGLENLNKYGIYSIDFLYVLLLLLAANEINSSKKAHMFVDTLKWISDKDSSLFDVVTSATDGGYRYGK